jgi:hypothetical protein
MSLEMHSLSKVFCRLTRKIANSVGEQREDSIGKAHSAKPSTVIYGPREGRSETGFQRLRRTLM